MLFGFSSFLGGSRALLCHLGCEGHLEFYKLSRSTGAGLGSGRKTLEQLPGNVLRGPQPWVSEFENRKQEKGEKQGSQLLKYFL